MSLLFGPLRRIYLDVQGKKYVQLQWLPDRHRIVDKVKMAQLAKELRQVTHYLEIDARKWKSPSCHNLINTFDRDWEAAFGYDWGVYTKHVKNGKDKEAFLALRKLADDINNCIKNNFLSSFVTDHYKMYVKKANAIECVVDDPKDPWPESRHSIDSMPSLDDDSYDSPPSYGD